MDKKKRILDQSGQQIHPNEDEGETNLPPGVQALIETRINSAIDGLREHNRDDLKDLARDHVRKWRYLALISSAIAIITIFFAPHQIITWIGKQVDTKLTEPMLQKSADRLIDSKMAKYVSDKMEPLNRRATELKSSIDEMNTTIAKKQAMLENQQKKLSGQLHIRELAIAAKAGSREAYTALLDMRGKKVDTSDLLTASLKEIELFYDADRNQLSFIHLVKKETKKDPGLSVDEVIFDMRNNPKHMEAAINTLSQLKSKAAVGELCKILNDSQDLRVAARATRAIEKITGEKIRPLEFDKLQNWWQKNKGNKVYLGDYDGYCEVAEKMWQPLVTRDSLSEFINSLSKTIDSNPNALHSMCLKAGFLVLIGELTQAKDLFVEVREIKSDYYWLYIWEAALKIKQGDLDSAIKSVNSAFAKSPTSDIERTLRHWNIFDAIKDNPKVDWPSKEKQDTQQNISAEAENSDSFSATEKQEN